MTLVLAVGHFALPFFFLMPRTVKRNADYTGGSGRAWLLADALRGRLLAGDARRSRGSGRDPASWTWRRCWRSAGRSWRPSAGCSSGARWCRPATRGFRSRSRSRTSDPGNSRGRLRPAEEARMRCSFVGRAALGAAICVVATGRLRGDDHRHRRSTTGKVPNLKPLGGRGRPGLRQEARRPVPNEVLVLGSRQHAWRTSWCGS